MADYTLKILNVCTGGEHIRTQIYKDGVEFKQVVLNKSEIMDSNIILDDILNPLIKATIKSSGASTMAQAKTAVEAMVITL